MAVPQNFRSALHGFNREDVVQYLEYINNKHQTQLNQLNEELTKLRERPEGIPEAELTAAKEQCAGLEQQVAELTAQLAQAQQRESDLTGQLEQAQQRENDLTEQLDQAQQRENDLAGLLDQVQQRKNTLAGQLDQARQRENSLSGQSSQFQQRENELTKQLNQAQQRESDLIRQLSHAKQRENDLTEQLNQSKQREARLSQQLSQNASQRGSWADKTKFQDDLEVFRLSAHSERSAREQSELVYHQANGVLSEATARVNAVSDDLTAAADRAMAQITQLQMAVSRSKQALQDAASIMQAIKPNRG